MSLPLLHVSSFTKKRDFKRSLATFFFGILCHKIFVIFEDSKFVICCDVFFYLTVLTLLYLRCVYTKYTDTSLFSKASMACKSHANTIERTFYFSWINNNLLLLLKPYEMDLIDIQKIVYQSKSQ